MIRSSSLQQKKITKKTPVKRVTEVQACVTKKLGKIGKNSSSSYLKKLKRYTKLGTKSLLLSPLFHSTFRVVTASFIAVATLYTSYLYIGKTFANEVVVSQSEIVSRVSKLTALPLGNPDEVVRVQDQESLRKQNPFYQDVKEGDYILMYKNTAVIYDLRNNVIVALKRTK